MVSKTDMAATLMGLMIDCRKQALIKESHK